MHVLRPTDTVTDPLAPYAEVDRRRTDETCWVLANMVGGLDGSAAVGGRVGALSDPADKQLFNLMRALADVVMVGAETIRREGYGPIPLPPDRRAARRKAGRPETPRLAVVSRSLSLDWSSSAFTDAPPDARTIVLTGKAADPERLAAARGVADVVVAGETGVEPAAAMAELWRLGHRVVLCEGGPTWLGELVATGHLDELCLTIAPLMGGDPLPVSVAPAGAGLETFTLQHVLTEGNTLFLRYERGER
jgi:riboflavin biosynthesis pyrimidine reductase